MHKCAVSLHSTHLLLPLELSEPAARAPHPAAVALRSGRSSLAARARPQRRRGGVDRTTKQRRSAERTQATLDRGGRRPALGGEGSEPAALGDARSAPATTRRGRADNGRRRSAGREADGARRGGRRAERRRGGVHGEGGAQAGLLFCLGRWESQFLGCRSQIPGMGSPFR
jgi:hypothetical protein